MGKMKAICIEKPGESDVLKLTEMDIPPVGREEVCIRVEAAGINRPDIFQRQGLYPPPAGVTNIPGLEVAGHIEFVGAGVTGFSKGDAVVALVPGGGYAEYCVAHTGSVLPLPEGLTMIEGASLPETYFTVWSNLVDRAHMQTGDSLLVHGGSSGIGSAAMQLAKAMGVTVYTTAGSDEKCNFCRTLGADMAINYKAEDFKEVILAATDRHGVDIILDMVGGDYIDRNIACLAVDGRHVSIAFLHGPVTQINMLPVMLRRLTLTGSTLRARSHRFKADIAEALRQNVWPLIEQKKIKPVIYDVFPLADAGYAHALMESSNHMGKIVLHVAGSAHAG